MLSGASVVGVVTTAMGETTICNESGKFHGIVLITNGAAAATCKVYDGLAAGAKIKGHVEVPAANLTGGFMLAGHVPCTEKINVVVTGAGATAYVYFSK